MEGSMSRALLAMPALLALLGAGAVQAQVPNNTLKVGVLTDMSGQFVQQPGQGSVVAAQMAAEDFAKEAGGLKVEIVSADHQNKPDIGSSMARGGPGQAGVTSLGDPP